MDRTVPRAGSEEIELYLRTYYSLLRSSAEIQIRTLEEAHAEMASSLHVNARSPEPDMPALIYSSLRLPACIAGVDRVILGQSAEVFRRRGAGDVRSWQPVSARARRRRSYYDGAGTLACYIASRSDIDDILPMLTAFQIEWNKLHIRMQGAQVRRFLELRSNGREALATLALGLGVDAADLERLRQVWGEAFWPNLEAISRGPKRIRVRLLAGSLVDYQRATQQWWKDVEEAVPSILERPVYFVSSNTHSLVNLLTGFALRREAELTRMVQEPGFEDLEAEWEEVKEQGSWGGRENFLYYALRKLLESERAGQTEAERTGVEEQCGVRRFRSEQSFDVEVQVIELARLRPDWLDPRLREPELERLRSSEALIVNIDYPLGMAAFHILSHLAARVGEVRGVYILGKAATLNGVIGDLMLPAVVYDEHSRNTYLIENCFSASNLGEDLTFGSVLDNQKAVSVRGTFLQNVRFMDVFYREGYTDIEMEAGPYLSAVYEMFRPKRHPENEVVNLYGLPFELGLIHYASDKPLNRGRNLAAASLSYHGVEPTYAASLAILRQVLRREIDSSGQRS